MSHISSIPSLPLYPCLDCGSAPGHLHRRGCPLEQCPACGQWGGCGCGSAVKSLLRVPWRGTYPGVMECREFGFIRKGSDPVGPEGVEDLNRLMRETHRGGVKWDRKWQRFVQKSTEVDGQDAAIKRNSLK